MRALGRFILYPWRKLQQSVSKFSAERSAEIETEFEKSLSSNKDLLRRNAQMKNDMDQSAAKFVQQLAHQAQGYSSNLKLRQQEVSEVAELAHKVRMGDASNEQLFQAMLKAKMLDPQTASVASAARVVQPMTEQLEPLKATIAAAKTELRKLEEKIMEENIQHMKQTSAKETQPKK